MFKKLTMGFVAVAAILAAIVYARIVGAQNASVVRSPHNPPGYRNMGAPLLGMPRVMLSPTGKLAFNVQGPSSTPTGSGGYSPMAPPIGRNIIGVRSGTAPSGSSFSGGPAVRWGMEMLTGPREIASAPRLGVPVSSTSSSATSVQRSATISSGCGSSSYGSPAAAVFNLEPATNAQPQNEVTVDFLPGQGASGADLVVEGANDFRGVGNFLNNNTPAFAGVAGYYVGNGCAPQFEGALPPLTGIFGELVRMQGDPIVHANATNNNVYYSTLAFSTLSTNVTNTTTAVGLFYSTAANLLACPSGTHSGTQSATCWNNSSTSAGILVNALPGGLQGPLEIDKPSMAVDQRGSGTGAGNVYVTGTLFDLFDNFSSIFLVACTSNLSACSDPVYISQGDASAQASDVKVDPYGNVTVVYVNYTFNGSGALTGGQIRYVACVPEAAPMNPSCNPPATANTDANILPQNGPMAANDFRVNSIPSHAFLKNVDGSVETWIGYANCSVTPVGETVCPNVGINLMSAQTTDTSGKLLSTPSGGATFYYQTSLGDRYMPWLTSDRNQNLIDFAYYANPPDIDPVTSYHLRHRVFLGFGQLLPGGTGPVNTALVNSLHDEPAADMVLGDSFFGDYNAAAARCSTFTTSGTCGSAGSTALYAGYTFNQRFGTYNTFGNVLQQDNLLSLVTY